jgi:hypothetical protein
LKFWPIFTIPPTILPDDDVLSILHKILNIYTTGLEFGPPIIPFRVDVISHIDEVVDASGYGDSTGYALATEDCDVSKLLSGEEFGIISSSRLDSRITAHERVSN